ASLSRKLYRDMIGDLAMLDPACKPVYRCLRRRCFQLGAGVQARFNCRARLRIAFSRSVSTCRAIVVSAHCPSPERCWRSTVTVSESECNARDRMKTLTRYRTFGLPGGEYQSVTIEPVSGSSEAYLTKSSVSCAACHRIGLTVRPVCGPGSLTDSFLARPSTVQIVASVSMPSGSLDDALWVSAAPGCPPARCSAGALATQAASANERLAARAAEGR